MYLKKIKLKSKKGMTLVELIIGITIIVIIFAATLGAMTSGYTSTVYNADKNRVAVKNASINEVIMKTVQKQEWDAKPASIPAIIDTVAKSEYGDIMYVDPGDFPKNNVDCQYTLIFDETSSRSTVHYAASTVDVPGVTIRTAMQSAQGIVMNESFVPYINY